MKRGDLIKTFISKIDNIDIEIEQIYETPSQKGYYLTLFYEGTREKTIHLYREYSTSRRAALIEAHRAIKINPPRIICEYINPKYL